MSDSRVLETRPNSRSAVVTRVVILTPLALVLLGALAFSATYLPASFIAVFILSISGIPAAFEAVAAIRDLRAEPTTTTGTVLRTWRKAGYLFFGHVHYMLVSGKVFEVSPITAREVHLDDRVVVEHWPHTRVVISVRRAPPESPATPSGSPSGSKD
ncbi:MAG: hypothetical protein WC273_10135 [Dehalococcoidia bacterium]